ncbi:MAG: hypothetical protein HQL50_10385, partial [Magnetococcales bacterium]|nr:hypothetical protein [Magnetococcales bacterium]
SEVAGAHEIVHHDIALLCAAVLIIAAIKPLRRWLGSLMPQPQAAGH